MIFAMAIVAGRTERQPHFAIVTRIGPALNEAARDQARDGPAQLRLVDADAVRQVVQRARRADGRAPRSRPIRRRQGSAGGDSAGPPRASARWKAPGCAAKRAGRGCALSCSSTRARDKQIRAFCAIVDCRNCRPRIDPTSAREARAREDTREDTMNVMQSPRRDEGTAYEIRPAKYKSELVEVGRGTPMGELLRRYWHPVGLVDACDRHAAPGPRARRRPDPVPRRRRAAPDWCMRAAVIAAPRSITARSRSAASAAAITAGCSTREGRCLEQPCEPEGGLFRDKVRQPWYPLEERYGLIFAYMGPPRAQAGAAALRMPRGDGRGRVRRGRRLLARRRRAGDHSVQLAAALRERGRSVPCAGAARLVQRRAVHHRDGRDAAGDLRDVAARRHGALDAPDGGRQDLLPRDRGRDPDLARGAQSARRAVRARRVDRLGAADRRYVVPHLCGGPLQADRAISAACAPSSTASSGGT